MAAASTGRAGEGGSVVVDATWLQPQRRRETRLVASATSSDLVELCCVAPDQIANERIQHRLATGRTESDATVRVRALMAGEATTWPEALALDASRPLDDTVREAARHVRGARRRDEWPCRGGRSVPHSTT